MAFTCPIAAPPGLCGNPEFQSCRIEVPVGGGQPPVERHFCIHEPSAPPSQEYPVVFGFHGAGGHAARMVDVWDKHTEQGLLLVAPTALESEPNCSRRWRTISDEHPDWSDFAAIDSCTTTPAVPRGHDLAMVEVMIQEIQSQTTPTGFYAAGFSSGGNMVHQLFITEHFADTFSGFAANAIPLSQVKIDAQAAAAGAGPLQPNHGIKKPMFLSMGTEDKITLPWDNFIASVDQLVADGECPLPQSARDVAGCYLQHETFSGLGMLNIISAPQATAAWYVAHNNSLTRGLQSLYPDLGHGSSFSDNVDTTVVVRQDFPKRPAQQDSAAVALLTIIGGGHEWPGQGGNAPPCTSGNCDIDLTEEILQFWRANAGLHSIWP